MHLENLNVQKSTVMPLDVMKAIASAWAATHFGDGTSADIWQDYGTWGIALHVGRLFSAYERTSYQRLVNKHDPEGKFKYHTEVRMPAYCVYHLPAWLSFKVFDEYVRNEVPAVHHFTSSYPAGRHGVVFMLEEDGDA